MTTKGRPLNILIDGDMIVFMVTSSVETPINWGSEEAPLWTLHAEENEARMKVDERIQGYTQSVLTKLKHKGEYNIIVCFSDTYNFRKDIYPLYKANRIGKRKPTCYYGVEQWVKKEYNCYQRNGLEADDCIGILATRPNTFNVIVSGDKDFKSIPGLFFNFTANALIEITLAEAQKWHYIQTLMGDPTDGYGGLPGVGEVSAKKILMAPGDPWDLIEQAYIKKKLTANDALIMARLARILHWEDYDRVNQKPILWTPKGKTND